MRIGSSLPSAALYRQRGRPLAVETAALLARMSVPPAAARKAQLDGLVQTLLAAGIWTKLDAFYILAAHDAQAARLNLVPWTGTVTNLIPNSTMQGADVAANTAPTGWNTSMGSSGLTRSIVGVGTMGGLPYVDMRLAGTLAQSGVVIAFSWAPTSATPAVGGGRYTHGVSFALTAGSFGTTQGAVNLLTVAADGTTTVDNASGPNIFGGLTVTLARQQLTMVASATAAQIAPRLRMTFGASGTAVDFTLRVAAPQLVRMDVPGNFIPTSGAAAAQVQTLYRFDLTAVNSPAFTMDRGFTGNGTTSYLDTNADPSLDFARTSLNSAAYGVWVSSETPSSARALGQGDSTTVVSPRSPADQANIRVHDGGTLVGAAPSSIGLTAGNRSGATARQMYRNGNVAASDAFPSSSMSTALWLLRALSYYPGQISAAFAGASLTAAEHIALHGALRTYLIGVGAST
ncbi:hypothetical protein V5F77_15175 [Xanthobacter sp. DSM 24535]|uniref:hypothetical protein n=1 Tax=Roseixanthobacter psychrophilus TaxID=3119917 RepID=UPI00372874C1